MRLGRGLRRLSAARAPVTTQVREDVRRRGLRRTLAGPATGEPRNEAANDCVCPLQRKELGHDTDAAQGAVAKQGACAVQEDFR